MYSFDENLFETYKEKGSTLTYYEDIISNIILSSNFDIFIDEFEETDVFRECVDKVSDKFVNPNMENLKYTFFKIKECLKIILFNPQKLKNQVIELQKIEQPEQRTPEWYKYREGRITASSWGNALGFSPEKAKGIIKCYLDKLGYEPVQFKGNIMTAWGTKYEPVATSIYERRIGKRVIEFGCLPHPNLDYHFIGASPDGITEDGTMLEIKCPYRRKITGIPPVYYWIQMQGQLEVCDLEKCDFLECEFKEYEDEEEYINDIGENGTISSGMESGIILEFKNGQNKMYEYSPFFMKGDDEDTWFLEKMNEYKKKGIFLDRRKYWKLETYSVVPVYRDRQWFEIYLPKLKIFYDKWMFYKENGYETLIQEYNEKNKIKEPDMSLKEYGFKNEEQSVLNGFAFKSIKQEEPKKSVLSGFGFSQPKTEEVVFSNFQKFSLD